MALKKTARIDKYQSVLHLFEPGVSYFLIIFWTGDPFSLLLAETKLTRFNQIRFIRSFVLFGE